jgi:hypothetical protein
MSELQVVEHEPEVLVPLDEHEAQRLDKRVRLMAGTARENFEKLGRLLDEAKNGRIHETLGFKSWTAYVADAVGGQLQLSGEARQALVQLMAGEGMSVRGIAAATGVSKSTVARDIDEVSQAGTPADDATDSQVSQTGTPDSNEPAGPPPTVIGLDGKEYTKPKRKPKGDKPRPRPVPKTVERIAAHLSGVAVAVAEMDPAEVDGQAMATQLASIAESFGTIGGFIDRVGGVPESSGRRLQVPTAFRGKVAELTALAADVAALMADPRWPKAVARLKEKDWEEVDAAFTELERLKATLVESAITAPSEPGVIDTVPVTEATE